MHDASAAQVPFARSSDGVQTLRRALAVLDLFQPDRPEWAAAEVARELGLTLPTASRFLRGLEQGGMLMRGRGRGFRLGFGAVDLGRRAVATIDLRENLHPVVRRLARDSGETAVIAVIGERRTSARIIDRVEGREFVYLSLDIGHTWPLHAGALAKALFAYMPDREAILEQPLSRVGKHTITDPAALRAELDRIRENGWAMSSEETDVGAWGIAKAILDPAGLPVAAIGLIAPLGRQTPEYTDRLVGLLEESIPEAQTCLGLSGEP